MKAIKVRIYPNTKTKGKLDYQLEQCRQLYNRILELLNQAWKNGQKLSQSLTQMMITIWKRQDLPNLTKVYSKVLQMVNYTLWANIKGLAQLKKNRHRIGRLRFKGKGWYKVLNFNQSGFKIANNQLHFSKIGWIKAKLYRTIPGKVKGILIKREQSGKWFAILQVEDTPEVLSKTSKQVGLDVGVHNLVADSDGKLFSNPKPLERNLSKLRKLQRDLSRKEKGSNNRRRARIKVAKLHEKIANQRKDLLHKLSTYYIQNHDTICVEALQITKIVQKAPWRRLRRNILDSAWGIFLDMLRYKAESADREVIQVDPTDTTDECAKCGVIVKKDLGDRIHKCTACGFETDRDYNAALVILTRGMGQAPICVEEHPLLSIVSSRDIIEGKVFL